MWEGAHFIARHEQVRTRSLLIEIRSLSELMSVCLQGLQGQVAHAGSTFMKLSKHVLRLPKLSKHVLRPPKLFKHVLRPPKLPSMSCAHQSFPSMCCATKAFQACAAPA